MSGMPSSLWDGVTQRDAARARTTTLQEPMRAPFTGFPWEEHQSNAYFLPRQISPQSSQLVSLASQPLNTNATNQIPQATQYSESDSSTGERTFEDPPIDPFRICSGAIVYVHSKEVCDNIGQIRSWPTNRVGPRRAPNGPAMRDPGYKHPAIILQWGRKEDETWWVLICNITSFDETTLEEYMQYRRDYGDNVDNRAVTRNLVKFYNTLPIAHRPFPPEYRNEVSFLSTTGGKLGCQSYVAMEGIYRVSDLHLRSYGEKYKNSWDMRLDKASYEKLMEEFGMVPQEYETEEKLVRAGKPRINVERSSKGNAPAKSHAPETSPGTGSLLSGTLFSATHIPVSYANSSNVEVPKYSITETFKKISTSKTNLRVCETLHNNSSKVPEGVSQLALNMSTAALETAGTIPSTAGASQDSVKAKSSPNYNSGAQHFVPRTGQPRLRQLAPVPQQLPTLRHMPDSHQDYYDMNSRPYPKPEHVEYGANHYQNRSHYQGGQEEYNARPQYQALPQYQAQLHYHGQLQYHGQVNYHGQVHYQTQTHFQTRVNYQGQVPSPTLQQPHFPQYMPGMQQGYYTFNPNSYSNPGYWRYGPHFYQG